MSVVVFGYRNADTILAAVRSVVTQDGADAIEVVVATSGGDETASLVRSAFPDVVVVESPVRLMPGGVRNAGVNAARGDVFAFLEGDCVAGPGWVRTRLALHRAGHSVVAGAVAPAACDGPMGRAFVYVLYAPRLVGHPPGEALPGQGYGLSFTRAVLDKVGPWDSMLRIGEDTVMLDRLESLGIDVWFDPAVYIQHAGPQSARELVRDMYDRGQRRAWFEVITAPAKPRREPYLSHRVLWVPTGLAWALKHLRRDANFVAPRAWDGCAEPRWQLLAAAPWMVLGLVVSRVGWLIGHRQAASPQGRSAEELPVGSPVRSWVAATGERVTALCFADGHGAHIATILDVLSAQGVKASFFVNGQQASAQPELVREIAAAGHAVGTTGWSGVPWTRIGGVDLELDLRRACAVVEELTGRAVRHTHPPKGEYDGAVVAYLREQGLEVWLETRPRDPWPREVTGELDVDEIGGLTPGKVIFFDRLPPAPAGALGRLIRMAARRGYRFVTVDDVRSPGQHTQEVHDRAQTRD